MFNHIIKYALLIFVLGYGILFTYSLASPQHIEQNARAFIKKKILEKTHQKIDNLGAKHIDNRLVKLSAKIFKQKTQRLNAYKKALKNKVGQKLAAVTGEMKNLDCECRKKYAKYIKGFFTAKITSLTQASKKLQEFMRYKYMQVVQNIIEDMRIFLGSSFFVLLFMLVLLFIKPLAKIQISLVSFLMLLSTLSTSYLYLFKQNWFYTILYSDYWGFWYIFYIGIIFLLLCDILFNKARITTEIINTILHGLGSALSAVPC